MHVRSVKVVCSLWKQYINMFGGYQEDEEELLISLLFVSENGGRKVSLSGTLLHLKFYHLHKSHCSILILRSLYL